MRRDISRNFYFLHNKFLCLDFTLFWVISTIGKKGIKWFCSIKKKTLKKNKFSHYLVRFKYFWRKNLLDLSTQWARLQTCKLSERGEGLPVPPTLTHHLCPHKETGAAIARTGGNQTQRFCSLFRKALINDEKKSSTRSCCLLIPKAV